MRGGDWLPEAVELQRKLHRALSECLDGASAELFFQAAQILRIELLSILTAIGDEPEAGQIVGLFDPAKMQADIGMYIQSGALRPATEGSRP